jgi:hypothetical protein
MRVVNRVLRDTGIFLGGGIIAERIIEQYPHYLNPGVAGYSVVSYGWPYEAVKIITTSANPPGYSFQTFTDNFLRNVGILGCIVLAAVEVPLISYETYKWKQRKACAKSSS